jgi:hypothetical protein
MTSFLEIPEMLRHASAKPQFLQWLSSMPIPNNAKRKLAQIWAANTMSTLSAIDYAIVMTPTHNTPRQPHA